METIILQLIREMVGEIVEIALESKLNLERLTPRILELLKCHAVEIVQHLITMTDKAMLEDKAGRRREGLVVERRANKRSVMTQLGEIRFERAYYLNQGTGNYGYPVDQLTGVMPYEHVDVGLSRALVRKSREESYDRAVKSCCEGKLSRQTVLNKIRAAEAVIAKPFQRRNVPELHFDAGEDHVALQGKRSRSRTNVPLISVYEGIDKDSKLTRRPGRTEAVHGTQGHLSGCQTPLNREGTHNGSALYSAALIWRSHRKNRRCRTAVPSGRTSLFPEAPGRYLRARVFHTASHRGHHR